MDSLTKENFFNELYAKYPKGVQVFCEWMDKYKEKNNWNKLFNSDSDWQDKDGKCAPAPKFHHLPYAMQFGILLTFMQEQTGQDEATLDMRGDIAFYFENLHGELTAQAAKKN